jgi:hypothetical protein
MVFIETPLFARRAAKLLSDDDLGAQTMLLLRPGAGTVIPESGGVRKVRVPAKGKGKSGGARVIYYWMQADGQIFLLFVYAKSERANLSAKEARLLREAAGL